MAKRYIGVDSGKFATKVAEYFPDSEKTRRFPIKTKVSEGDFRDDAIEENTVIVDIDGRQLKVGNGARGEGVELSTDKKTDVHKTCLLTALASVASANEVDEFNVATGLPAKDWANVSKRIDYKEYMLPTEKEITVSIKRSSSSPVQKKTFVIKNGFVFPESIGALFMDGVIETITPNSIVGVLDIGNLNLNATLWQGVELLQDKSATADLGGAILIQELSQELSAKIVRCDELVTANILRSKERALPKCGTITDEQVEESRRLIKKVLQRHADSVKRCCHARNWSLDVTKIIAIGGTSVDIADELKEAFNGNITVLDNASYCNALGYLRMMCARLDEIEHDVIPLNFIA